jgi:hypothetical protein
MDLVEKEHRPAIGGLEAERRRIDDLADLTYADRRRVRALE